jgi:hypothetical protein
MEMIKRNLTWFQLAALSFILALPAAATAAQDIISPLVGEVPVLDGSCNEAAWQATPSYTIRDKRVNVDIILKSVHTKEMVFFCVKYPDPDESRLHKPWVWDKKLELYTIGPQMGDTFMFRWNMGDREVDLSDYSDDAFTADIWYWKANRTNPVGYADDMYHTLTETETNKSRLMLSRSGKKRHLLRLADEGTPAYESTIELDYRGDLLPQYKLLTPSGSRADVKAKGIWQEKWWTIEFGRKLNTGHGDDVQFTSHGARKYLFGVSIKALYGEPLDDKATNLYGQGRISEPLRLILK